MNLELKYNGNTLPADITQYLINYSENKMNVPPSYLITKLHYEGLWGSSTIGRENNNWAGMTWGENWSEPYKRPSGVIVTKGSPRPANEGGHYIKYKNTDDFLKDWAYLIRPGGVYNVANSKTFDEAVKGMFIYGGAQYDYATMNVSGSKRRYELYLEGMKGRRNAINNANNGILDKLDSEDFSTDEKVDVGNSDYPTILEESNKIYDEIKKGLTELQANMIDMIEKMLNPYVYKYNDSKYMGNSFLSVIEIDERINKIKVTGNVKKLFSDFIEDTNEKLDDKNKEKNDKEKKDDDKLPNPNKNNTPAIPHKQPYRITSPYGWRVHPVDGTKKFHAGTDFADMTPGNKVPVYATQSGKITVSRFSDSGGWMVYIQHTGDKYHSRYLHLDSKPMVNVGENVKKGQQIGISGTTGKSTGVHLHFEIATSQQGFGTEAGTIDPEKYLKMRF